MPEIGYATLWSFTLNQLARGQNLFSKARKIYDNTRGLGNKVIKLQVACLITGLLPLIIYLRTMAPTITWRNDGADGGDLATAVAVGGVPHPPGYPTYLILGQVFKLLPFGDVAYRLNLLSATCAALTVVLTGLIIYQTLSRAAHQQQIKDNKPPDQKLIWLSATAASLSLAFAGPFWSQATIVEVYTLNTFFTAALLYGAMQVNSANERWLVPGLSGLLALGLGNHVSILLLCPLLLWILRIKWRWSLMATSLLAFWVGVSVYFIVPLRAATFPPVNWGLAITWPNFLWLVSAEPYRQFLFALPWPSVPVRIIAELRLLAEVFVWWGIPIGLLGLWNLFRLNRTLAYSSGLTFLLVSIYTIGYNTNDSYVYLLPALLIFAVWIGWGLYSVGNALQKLQILKFGSGSLVWGIILLPILPVLINFSAQNISQDDTAYVYAQQNLLIVEPGAVIVTENDSHTFALWYGRYGQGLRPDVAIINSNLLPYAWYRQAVARTHPNLRLLDQLGQPITTLPTFIELNLSNMPIYLATIQPPLLEDYRLEALDQLQRVSALTDN